MNKNCKELMVVMNDGIIFTIKHEPTKEDIKKMKLLIELGILPQNIDFIIWQIDKMIDYGIWNMTGIKSIECNKEYYDIFGEYINIIDKCYKKDINIVIK